MLLLRFGAVALVFSNNSRRTVGLKRTKRYSGGRAQTCEALRNKRGEVALIRRRNATRVSQ